MIIEDNEDVQLNIAIAIRANSEITGMKLNIRDKSTLESTFSSCIYYDTDRLQASSIVCKLSQNQSFIDGNKRTALFMLNYYDMVYNLGKKNMNDYEVSDLILKTANDHLAPEQFSKLAFK